MSVFSDPTYARLVAFLDLIGDHAPTESLKSFAGFTRLDLQSLRNDVEEELNNLHKTIERHVDTIYQLQDQLTDARWEQDRKQDQIKQLKTELDLLRYGPPKLNQHGITDVEHNLIREGKIIAAIKEYRIRTSAGLKDAKDKIEDVLYNQYKMPWSGTYQGDKMDEWYAYLAQNCPAWVAV